MFAAQNFQLRQLEQLEEIGERVPRVVPRDRNDPFTSLSDDEFVQRFQLAKDSIHDLIEEIRPHAPRPQPGKEWSIHLHLQVLVTLRYLVTGSFQICLADTLTMATSSACRSVARIARLIAYLAPDYVTFPTLANEHINSTKFFQIVQLPGVLACVDGTHVPIIGVGGPAAEYYRCRKGFYSMNVQGACDADLKFVNFVASWPGSTHDARIFEASRLCARLEGGAYRGYLLGDSGYPCRPHLLTPVPETGHLREDQRRYSAANSKTRNVERAFGGA